MRHNPEQAEIVARLEQIFPELRSLQTAAGENGDDLCYRRQLELLKELFDLLVRLRKSGAAADEGLEEVLSSDLAKSFALAALAPEIVARAREEIDEEVLLAGIREVLETGGLELNDFIDEIEEAAGIDE
jgi:hypothetical protein